MDTYSYRQPLGVCAGVTPFNFPAMIPLWMFPLAIACGNTYVLKPSERNPGASLMIAQLAKEAGVFCESAPHLLVRVTCLSYFSLLTLNLMLFWGYAGVPAGVLNIIHGTHDAVNFICDDPNVKVI
jgi:malonate-semialdehyde dehydrogenase (acetylating)/methylmalonate-semialdehyde dehydrogenase